MSRVRMGAIGAGWWASTNHFPRLAARPDVELVAVCSRGPGLKVARDRFGFRVATEDYRELLELDLDAVVIATPHDQHHEQAAAALERGLHVMCEKPMTLRAEQAWDLVERTRRAGVHVLVPYGWHYAPFVVEAKRLLDAGILGEVQFVSSHMASPTRDFFGGDVAGVPSQWEGEVGPEAGTWQAPEHGGGYAHGQLTHVTALTAWLTGLRATTVTGQMSRAGAAVDLYDAAVLRFDNGALGVLSGAATLPDGDPFQVDVRIFGTEGVLLLDVERERMQVRRHDGRHVAVDVTPGAGAYDCDVPPHRFVELITGASRENNSPPEVAARSVEILEALAMSAERGGTSVEVRAVANAPAR